MFTVTKLTKKLITKECCLFSFLITTEKGTETNFSSIVNDYLIIVKIIGALSI